MVEKAVPPEALAQDRLDQLLLRPAGGLRGAAIDLLRPEVAVEVDLQHPDLARLHIEPEFIAPIVERAEDLDHLASEFVDPGLPLAVGEFDELIFLGPVDQVALLIISAKVRRIGPLEEHHRDRKSTRLNSVTNAHL